MSHFLYPEKVVITNDEINELPLGAYDGAIELIYEKNTLRRVFDEINEHKAVGFDTETRPTFTRGQLHKVALMQIAIPKKVFLIRLNLTGFTSEIISFLENESIEKIGVALRDDIKALERLKRFKPAGIVELTTLTKQAGIEVESVKKLAGLFLGFRISKGAQTSNWEAPELNEKQISYAATDAWVCLEVFNMVSKRQALAV
jgi:ribonuclease D